MGDLNYRVVDSQAKALLEAGEIQKLLESDQVLSFAILKNLLNF